MKRWRRASKIKLIEEFNPDCDDLTSKLNSSLRLVSRRARTQ